ncbi:PIR Superfamily Protein [Plasmodium ovale curtisi]|uniref:PIR Superfamily Protein n=1 Tax=Plasmodium ovale curtisi TaxID=864141 RepID=A0A1A8W962_PLAOA|nr:PIR Superfamily Protein [Plasmodium ovale curtisi]
MDCDSLIINETYRFFSVFDAYKSLMENVPISTTENKVLKTCDSLPSDSIFDKVPSSNEICKQFIYLYSKLSTTRKGKKKSTSLDDNDYSFMNYWINDTLSSSNVDAPKYIKELYEKLKSADDNFIKGEFPENNFKKINLHDLENIKILNNLYKYMDEISSMVTVCESNDECEPFLKNNGEFKEKYKEVIINCIDGCSGIYNALELFKCKYNQEIVGYANTLSKFKFNKLDELQDYNFLLKNNKKKQFKRIITIPTLFPMFGLLFMLIFSNMVKGTTYTILSPFRQFLIEEIKTIKNIGIFEYGTKKLLLRSSYNENINLDYGEYNIGYHSVRDA